MKKNSETKNLWFSLWLFVIYLLVIYLPLQQKKTKAEAKLHGRELNELSREENKETHLKKLTIGQLRKFQGLEYLSDAEALEKIEGLYQLSLLTFKLYNNEVRKL